MEIVFTIDSKIVPKERPRFKGHAYTPNKTKNFEELVRIAYMQSKHHKCFEKAVPIAVIITVYHKIPKRLSKADRMSAIKGETYPTKRPDWDNDGKSICDALNGYAYHDDAQVVVGIVRKLWAMNDYIEVRIMDVEDLKWNSLMNQC